jgi:osmotically-inducible protein OsmY
MNTPQFRNTLIAIGVVSAMGVGTGAFATQTTASTASLSSMAETDGVQPAYTHLSSDIIGANVTHTGEQNHATIRHLVIDDKGVVTHVVLGYGGILGVGEEDYIVPFSELTFTQSDEELTVHTELARAQVQKMPEFRTRVEANEENESASQVRTHVAADDNMTAPENSVTRTTFEANESNGETASNATESQKVTSDTGATTYSTTAGDDQVIVTTSDAGNSMGESINDATDSAGAALGEATSETQRVASDTWITTKVKSAILADNISQGFEVGVTTLHGEVVLEGDLRNQQSVDLVASIAKRVEGVKSVDTSRLTIQ